MSRAGDTRIFKARCQVMNGGPESPRITQLEAKLSAQARLMEDLQKHGAYAVSDWTVEVRYDHKVRAEFVEVEVLGEFYD